MREEDLGIQRPPDHHQASHVRWDPSPLESRASLKSIIQIMFQSHCISFKDTPAAADAPDEPDC